MRLKQPASQRRCSGGGPRQPTWQQGWVTTWLMCSSQQPALPASSLAVPQEHARVMRACEAGWSPSARPWLPAIVRLSYPASSMPPPHLPPCPWMLHAKPPGASDGSQGHKQFLRSIMDWAAACCTAPLILRLGTAEPHLVQRRCCLSQEHNVTDGYLGTGLADNSKPGRCRYRP